MGIQLTRKKLEQKLLEYVESKITLDELQSWHEDMIKNDFESNDWDKDDSLIVEIMSKIDLSDIDGLTKIDVKKIIILLGSNKNSKKLIIDFYNLEKKHE